MAKAFPGRLSRRDVVSVALLGGFAFVGLFLILQGLDDGAGFDARIIVGLVVVLIVPAAAYRFSRAARAEGQGAALAPAASDRDPLAEAIESMHEGVALFDSGDRLVLCNRLYRELFAEAGAPVASGTRFEDMLRAFVSRGRIADLGKDPEIVDSPPPRGAPQPARSGQDLSRRRPLPADRRVRHRRRRHRLDPDRHHRDRA